MPLHFSLGNRVRLYLKKIKKKIKLKIKRGESLTTKKTRAVEHSCGNPLGQKKYETLKMQNIQKKMNNILGYIMGY